MGLIDFLKDAGENLFKGGADEGDQIKDKIHRDLGSNVKLDRVEFDDGRVMLHGEAKSMAAKEKAALIAGNVKGVSAVNDNGLLVKGAPRAGVGAPGLGSSAPAAKPAASAAARTQYYTIQSGDSLSKIAKEKYGEMDKWKGLFEANKEVIQDPDKIYPGQVIRIPPEDSL
jgi:nucleoid-associated protein YgaU